MTKAIAVPPHTPLPDNTIENDQNLNPTLPIDSYDGTDENDDAIAELKDNSIGKLGEDESLNDGDSAYSDHESNGPKSKINQ